MVVESTFHGGHHVPARKAETKAPQVSRAEERPSDTVGWLIAFGKNQSGQLGIGTKPHNGAPHLLSIIERVPILGVSCGLSHSAAWTADGKLFTWGCGGNGRLGHGDIAEQWVPTIVVDLVASHVVQVSCGDTHTVVLTALGSVYTFGSNAIGQLGHADSADVPTPRHLKGVGSPDCHAVWVSAGAEHTAAVDAHGRLFTWGSNENCELGLGHNMSQCTPSLVYIPCRVSAVSCGAGYTLALSDDGSLWSCGGNQFGRLGLGHTESVDQFERVKAFDGKGVVSISAGWWHAAAVDSQGLVYTWGKSSRGALGLGKSVNTNQPTPKQVKMNISTYDRVVTVSCGWSHTFITTSMHQMWAWGSSSDGELGLDPMGEQWTPVRIRNGDRLRPRRVICGDQSTHGNPVPDPPQDIKTQPLMEKKTPGATPQKISPLDTMPASVPHSQEKTPKVKRPATAGGRIPEPSPMKSAPKDPSYTPVREETKKAKVPDAVRKTPPVIQTQVGMKENVDTGNLEKMLRMEQERADLERQVQKLSRRLTQNEEAFREVIRTMQEKVEENAQNYVKEQKTNEERLTQKCEEVEDWKARYNDLVEEATASIEQTNTKYLIELGKANAARTGAEHRLEDSLKDHKKTATYFNALDRVSEKFCLLKVNSKNLFTKSSSFGYWKGLASKRSSHRQFVVLQRCLSNLIRGFNIWKLSVRQRRRNSKLLKAASRRTSYRAQLTAIAQWKQFYVKNRKIKSVMRNRDGAKGKSMSLNALQAWRIKTLQEKNNQRDSALVKYASTFQSLLENPSFQQVLKDYPMDVDGPSVDFSEVLVRMCEIERHDVKKSIRERMGNFALTRRENERKSSFLNHWRLHVLQTQRGRVLDANERLETELGGFKRRFDDHLQGFHNLVEHIAPSSASPLNSTSPPTVPPTRSLDRYR